MSISTNKIRTSSCRRSILVWAVSILLPLVAELSNANPKGGKVIGGQASISSQTNRLDINQSSHKAIIDWRSFNIPQGEHTNFNQPSSSALTLNRVRGNQISQINGRLTANGQIFLINPNGVIFGPDAKVTAAGLMTTTADIRNNDFMSGNYRFTLSSSNPNARITNLGQISVNDKGAVILAAATVNNKGIIQAKLGNVNLASANTFTLDFYGDGLLSFEIEGQVTQKPDTISGDSALLNNSGSIIADGGTVTLTAQAADAVIDRVINMDGIIQAKTLIKDKGKIVLSGGDHGIVDVSGTLDASGTEKNETGGAVHVLGEKVGLFDGTHVNADAYAGGGKVLIGGNFQGKGGEPNAQQTYVAKSTKITANAIENGNGGRVIVWADKSTQYYGEITANGGKKSGDGGFVEVSGKQQLGFNGAISVDSTQGNIGTILLDPESIIIQAGASPDDDQVLNDAVNLFANDNTVADFVISDTILENLTGNLVLQAIQDITINEQLDLNNQISGNSVVFQAGDDISINASIITQGANVTLEANSPHLSPPLDDNGTLSITSGMQIDTSNGVVTLIGGSFSGFFAGTINAGMGNINIVRSHSAPSFDTASFADLRDFHTSGILTFGQATTAGSNGLGMDSIVLAANNVTLDGTLQSSAQTTLLLAENNISFTGGNGIDVSQDRDVTFRAGNNILLDRPIILDQGNFIAEADSTIHMTAGDGDGDLTLSEPITTNGGSVFLAGEVVQIIEPFSNAPEKSITAESGNISFTTNSLILGGFISSVFQPLPADAISARGILTIQPRTTTLAIGLGSASAGLNLDQQALDSFADGFSLISFGRTDGAHNIEIANATFRDPVKLQAPTGGLINISDSLIMGDNSISFDTPGNITALNTNNDFSSIIINNANNVSLTDTNSIDLGRTIINGTLNITANNNITSSGTLSITGAGLFSADTSVSLEHQNNNFLGPVSVSTITPGNNIDVSIVNNGNLILGESDLGNGSFNYSGLGISQIAKVEVGDTTLNINNGSVLLNNSQNNFTGTFNLNVSGSENIEISDINFLQLGTVTIDSNLLSITAQDINISNSLSTIGAGNLIIRPTSLTQNIGIANGVGTFNLSQSDITNITDGFSSITIGRSDLTGEINIEDATFIDPLTLLGSGAGASITINGVLTGEDNASITLEGSGATTTLNGNIVTNGNPILINDAVLLGNPVISNGPIVLDTTAGGAFPGAGITFSNTVNGSTALTLSAGASVGDISFNRDVGAITPLGDVNILSANTIQTGSPFIANEVNINATQIIINNVSTTGLQQYSGNLELSGDFNTGGGDFIVTGTTNAFGDTTILTQGGEIRFDGSINNNTDDGNLTLDLNAGSGEVNLLSPVGGTSPIGELLINASTIATQGVSTEEDTIFGVFHNGNQQYDGLVTLNNNYSTNGGSFTVNGNTTLGSNTTVTTAGGNIQFGNISANEANSLVLDAGLAGQVTLNDINEPLLLNNPQNDFIGTLSLFATGTNNIEIFDANLLQLGSSSIGANELTITAQDLNIIGSINPTVTGEGNLILQPIDQTQTIGLGDGTGSFNLTQSEIDNISTGFSSITIGSSAGTGNIDIDNATFNDPLTIEQANESGASITVTGVLTGNDDASITLNGSGTTTFLNGNIITQGNNITINDAVVLGTPVDQGNPIALDSTAGGLFSGAGITVLGPVSGSTTLAINAGAGFIDLNNPVNNFTGSLILNNTGNNNVNVTNNASLTLGASNVGNGELNLTATEITQTGAITQQAGASATLFTASTGAINLTQENDFTSTISLNTTGANNISIVDVNTLNLSSSSIGTGDFDVKAGDLNITGSISNSGGNLIMQPFAVNQSIGLGDGTGTFSLTQSEIDNISTGFSSITIGSSTGTGNIAIDNTTLTDPLIIEQANGSGASITVNGLLTGNDDASITLNGSGSTTVLNGNIITQGNTITINDTVILGTAVNQENSIMLDSTAGGLSSGAGITVTGPVSGATPLALNAGAAGIDLSNPTNNFTGTLILNNTGNNNINVTNTNSLILGTSNVGSGQLNIIAADITQTGSFTQQAGAASTHFSASTGPIDLTQANDFTSTVSLNTTGANDISIVDINTLNLSSSSIGTGDFEVKAGDLNITGPISNSAGNLTLQPFDISQSIGLGAGAGSFSLTQSEIDNISTGFSSISIGSSTGTGNIIVNNATFNDPLELVQENGSGANITINNVLTGADDASITLNGSGTTTILNGNIITHGNSITINDAVILGTPISPGNSIMLDTTAAGVFLGADITASGPVNGPTPLTLTAGTGTIDLTNPTNDFTGTLILNNTGNNNIYVTNTTSLILGTSNVGSGQLNLTGTEITQTGTITQQTGAATTHFTASTGSLVLTQANDFTGTISLNTTGANDINIVDINTLNLSSSSIGTGDFEVKAGDLNITGPISNSAGNLTLQPFDISQSIGLGAGAGSFSLTQSEIDNISTGFSSITIGSSTGTGNIAIDNATFNAPLNIVQAKGSGASITVNNILTGAGDASITLDGSGTTTILNGNIITQGNPITINDAVILGTPIIPGSSIVLDTTDGGVFPGAGITFSSTIDGTTSLNLSAGANTGNILFQSAVAIGDLTIFNANNINMNAQFVASDTSLTFSGIWQNKIGSPVTLDSLFVTPLARGSTVFGSINGFEDIFSSQHVTGVKGDPRFTINGCIMGIFCGIPGIPDTEKTDVPPDTDPYPLVKLKLMNVWEQQKRLQDPRDERYSNLGNEELWRGKTKKLSF